MLKEKPFYYLRHGQTDWNLQGLAQGQSNIPLNTQGILQAHAAKAQMIGKRISRICCSPLDRALQTAHIVNEALNVPITQIDELAEANWGEREGQLMGQWFNEWKQGITPANAESYNQFLARALLGINQALDFSDKVLIVAHGGVYWSVQHYAKLDTDGTLANCQPIYHIPPQNNTEYWATKIITK